ncbi:hypothetical protein R1flu_003698 [Riccia fluitans]|uniref:Calcineurin-like phosphoesterase domain-containing protein n=1 Tax=Riccia fluitans TaxID=41844 RepID=A0ABD1Y9W4_9MARC
MGLRSQYMVTIFVAGLWAISLLYGEMFAFWVPLFSCTWPALKDGSTAGNTHVKSIKIALIPDPQITHKDAGGASVTNMKFSEFYSDIYMRRAFRSSVLEMYPDRVIILGDLLEGGSLLSDPEWEALHRRFEHVFDQSQRVSQGLERVPVDYLPGIQDLGSVDVQSKVPEIRSRNEAAFGALEYSINVGGAEFLFTNPRAFDGLESSMKENASWGLLSKISSDDEVQPPRVLFTSVPLYKPSNAPCRAKKNDESVRRTLSLNADKPEEYLTSETTTRLLNLTKPIMVVSAHGRHVCSMNHTTVYGSIIEHTAGTFNWLQENLYPSFMMISVASEPVSGSSDLVSVSVCFLPVQTRIYAWYLVSLVSGLLAIFAWPTQGVDLYGVVVKVHQYFREIFRPDGGVKLKDEDADNGDWEMMWDAEGGMHLVKAQKVVSATGNATQGGDRRGSAFARSAARRQSALDLEESVMTMESNLKDTVTMRAKTHMLPIRLLQALGPLAVLASSSLSLYVMLLMKDWT